MSLWPLRPVSRYAGSFEGHDRLLRAWDDAPAVILSCPGPLRRHHAAIQPVSGLSLPQCLLGGEAQLQAFAASATELAPRLFFAPMPELFSTPQSMQALQLATGGHAFSQSSRPVHLRFGGTRSARIMKDARNGLVLAEDHAAPPISASQHPFANGLTLPAQMRRLFIYDRAVARPVILGGAALPITQLPPDCVTADLKAGLAEPAAADASDGLEVVSLSEFRSSAWAAGPVRGRSPHLREARDAAGTGGPPFVLLPWNLDHPGSAVPTLVERTLRLQSPGAPAVRLVLMPFNYPGQTGLIRRLIRQAREAAMAGDKSLSQVFIGRLTHLRALRDLLALATAAWVDGNDPEAAWTVRRLAACGIKPILLGVPGDAPPSQTAAVPANDTLTITAETRFGQLHYRSHMPSLRALHDLLPMTRDLAGAPRPRRSARARAGS